MSSRLREIAASLAGKFGLVGVADVHMCMRSGAYQPYSYWEQWAQGNTTHFHTDIETALGLMTPLRNDVLLLSPDSHSQADTITWNEDITHFIGMYPPAMMNLRSRIGHSANFDKLLQITAYGCLFANLYLQYGRGNAANLTCLSIEDNRNSFYHCHFAAPLHTTEGDQATFKVINIAEAAGGDGLEHYFNHCTIGIETTLWTNGDMIKISGTPRLVFEDCILLMRSDNAQVTFLDGTAGDGQGFILFKNTTGVNLGTALTVALGSTGIAAATDIILHNSGFSGATDLIAAADEAKAKMIAGSGITADEQVGLAIDFDHTA